MPTLTYANGVAPESALTIVDGIHMSPTLAPRVRALITFAATQGRAVRVAHWYGGYRNLSEQGKLSGTGNSASTIPVAAVGKSTHGVYDPGRVDFVGADGFSYTASDLAWIVANAPSFGLVREFGSADPNHFMAHGDWSPAAAPVTPKEPKMFILAMQSSTYRNGMWLIAPHFLHAFTPDQWNTIGGWLQTAGVWVFTPPSDFAFDRLIESFSVDANPFPFRGDLALAPFVGATPVQLGGAAPVLTTAQITAIATELIRQLSLNITLTGKAVPA